MSKLCENCPLAGKACEEIIGISTVSSARASIGNVFGYGLSSSIANLGALVDEEGHISEVINLPKPESGQKVINLLLPAVDECTKPTPQTGFWNRLVHRKPICSALGALAVDRTFPLEAIAADAVAPSLQAQGLVMSAINRLRQNAS